MMLSSHTGAARANCPERRRRVSDSSDYGVYLVAQTKSGRFEERGNHRLDGDSSIERVCLSKKDRHGSSRRRTLRSAERCESDPGIIHSKGQEAIPWAQWQQQAYLSAAPSHPFFPNIFGGRESAHQRNHDQAALSLPQSQDSFSFRKSWSPVQGPSANGISYPHQSLQVGEDQWRVERNDRGTSYQMLVQWKRNAPKICCVCLRSKTPKCRPKELFIPESSSRGHRRGESGHSGQKCPSTTLTCANARCDVVVHPECYLLPMEDPALASALRQRYASSNDDPWYCDRCMSLQSSQLCCAFCPILSGDIKPVPHRPGVWAHIVCARYLCNVTVVPVTQQSQPAVHKALHSGRHASTVAQHVYRRSASDFGTSNASFLPISPASVGTPGGMTDPVGKIIKCSYCPRASEAIYGLLLKCQAANCENYFHVSCAHRRGTLALRAPTAQSTGDSSGNGHNACSTVKCMQHTAEVPPLSEWVEWANSRPEDCKPSIIPSSDQGISAIETSSSLYLWSDDDDDDEDVGGQMRANQPPRSQDNLDLDTRLASLVQAVLKGSNEVASTARHLMHHTLGELLGPRLEDWAIAQQATVAPRFTSSLKRDMAPVSKPHKVFLISQLENLQTNNQADKWQHDAHRPHPEVGGIDEQPPNTGMHGSSAQPAAAQAQAYRQTGGGEQHKSSSQELRPPMVRASPEDSPDASLSSWDEPPDVGTTHDYVPNTTPLFDVDEQERVLGMEAQARIHDEYYPPSSDAGLARQEIRFPGDLYTPLWTRGIARYKEGLCRLCPPEAWYKIKISAYWYHLNFYHGVSSITGRPFPFPAQERYNGTLRIREGLCTKCHSWIALDSVRHTTVNVPEIYWWKHAQKCHQRGITASSYAAAMYHAAAAEDSSFDS